jgi:hypothetical protein
MTHTFEIIVSGFSIQGEISFRGGLGPTITTNKKPTGMRLKDWKRTGKILDSFAVMCKDYGEIQKIEIVKKM